MSVIFLFHHEDEDPYPLRLGLNMMCGMYGYHLMHIDCVGDMLAVSNEPYISLDAALFDPRFYEYTWVFLDHRATKTLDEFTHPVDDVVYVFGSDRNGFDRPTEELPGEIIKLKSWHHAEYQHFGFLCGLTVAIHRFYQVDVE